MVQHSFARKERLTKNQSIKLVFEKGDFYRHKFISIYIYKPQRESDDVNRAAFIVKRQLCDKKSVLRNRFRRIVAEAYRRTKHFFSGHGCDIIILATHIKKNTKSGEIENELKDAFKKCANKYN